MNYTKEKLEKLQHRWTTEKGKKLLDKIKKTRCYLSPVLFREVVNNFPFINDPEIEDRIDLRGAPLSGFDFRIPIQETEDYTEEMVVLSNIHFEGAKLKYCNFQNGKIHDCHFENADLNHSTFRGTNINTCHFHLANVSNVDMYAAHIINCNFSDANIKDIVLNQAIVDEKTNFGKQLKSYKDGHYHFASIEYKQLKSLYKNSSLHEKADEMHLNEWRARRLLKKSKFLQLLDYVFGDLVSRYGTSYLAVLFWSMILIMACSIVYLTPQSLAFHGDKINPNIFETIYFSIVTFTTLGYGDYSAVGAMRFVAATEAFMGTALMALFTVIAARAIIRD